MIYFIQEERSKLIKVGFTAKDPRKRKSELQVSTPFRLALLGVIPGSPDDEAALHQRFADARVSGEWFLPAEEILALAASGKAWVNAWTHGRQGIHSYLAEARAPAEARIRVLLANGPLQSSDLIRTLRKEGFSRGTILRARKRLGV